MFNSKVTLDHLYSITTELESLYADRVKLASIYDDKITLDSVYANRDAISSAYANLAAINALFADIDNLNRYDQEYTIGATEPASPFTGYLWFDTNTNVLKYYDGANWRRPGDTFNIGVEQTWVDESTNRLVTTDYSNTFEKPIQVVIEAATTDNTSTYTLNGLIVGFTHTTSFIVPPGTVYQATPAGGIASWNELK